MKFKSALALFVVGVIAFFLSLAAPLAGAAEECFDGPNAEVYCFETDGLGEDTVDTTIASDIVDPYVVPPADTNVNTLTPATTDPEAATSSTSTELALTGSSTTLLVGAIGLALLFLGAVLVRCRVRSLA